MNQVRHLYHPLRLLSPLRVLEGNFEGGLRTMKAHAFSCFEQIGVTGSAVCAFPTHPSLDPFTYDPRLSSDLR